MLSAKKKKVHPRLTIRVDEDVYMRLKELKSTEKGRVSFSGILRWLLEQAGR